mgnify:CR=1 FL=1
MAKYISTHAPRAGSDFDQMEQVINTLKFQPTLPVRGATDAHRERDVPSPISTHAPRAGSDESALHARVAYHNFNPRSPCGERQTRL